MQDLMKKILIALLLFAEGVSAQVKITDMPTYIGNPNGGWVPVVISGTNRKVDASYFGLNKIDSITTAQGTNFDSLWAWKNGVKSFYKLVRAGGGDKDTIDKKWGTIVEQPNANKIVVSARVVGVQSTAELRGIGTLFSTVDTQFVIQITNYTQNYTQYYQYDPFDVTSVDDDATIIKAGSKVFRALFPNGMVNVKIFKAKGNGVADDWFSIQNGVDAIIANPKLPKNLFFPRGDYHISAPDNDL
jgi:hypothetical protein